MKPKLVAACALVALCCAPFALAEVDSYRELKSAPSEVIANATAADSITATTVITDRMRSSNSNTTVAVSVDFSGTAGDTVVVSCLLFQDGTFIGVQTATATAGSYVDAAGDNVAPLLFFDLGGASTYEIRHAAPSVGNVDLTWWAYGAESRQ